MWTSHTLTTTDLALPKAVTAVLDTAAAVCVRVYMCLLCICVHAAAFVSEDQQNGSKVPAAAVMMMLTCGQPVFKLCEHVPTCNLGKGVLVLHKSSDTYMLTNPAETQMKLLHEANTHAHDVADHMPIHTCTVFLQEQNNRTKWGRDQRPGCCPANPSMAIHTLAPITCE